MKILEIGSGYLPRHRHLEGQNITRLDINPHAYDVDLCQDICDPLPLPDQHFDLVYCAHVLEHVDDPVKALANMARVGQHLQLRVPNFDFYKIYPELDDTDHKWFWTPTQFKTLCSMFIKNPVMRLNRFTYSVAIRRALFLVLSLFAGPNEIEVYGPSAYLHSADQPPKYAL